MKKALFISCLCTLSVSSTLKAQPHKGDWLAGVSLFGTTSYRNNYNYSGTSINIAPRGSYFITNRFAVGLSTGLSYARGPEKSYVLNYDVSPFMRYYFSRKEGIRLHRPVVFTEVSAGIGGYKHVDRVNQLGSAHTYRTVNVGVGVAYQLNKYVSLEGMVTLGKPRGHVGINVLIPGKKKNADIK